MDTEIACVDELMKILLAAYLKRSQRELNEEFVRYSILMEIMPNSAFYRLLWLSLLRSTVVLKAFPIIKPIILDMSIILYIVTIRTCRFELAQLIAYSSLTRLVVSRLLPYP